MRDTAPAAMSGHPAGEFQKLAREADLAAYARIFPWTCFATFILCGLPTLLLDPDGNHYSHTIAWSGGGTAILAGVIGLWSGLTSSPGTNSVGHTCIKLGALLLLCLAFVNALFLIDTLEFRHAAAGALTMICVALIYPRAFGVILVSLPQLAVVVWLGFQNGWPASWSFAFFMTLSGALIAGLSFYTRKFYSLRNYALLAERTRMIEALRTESHERELLQEQVLTERNLTTLGRLAGGIAHDLNNILVPILGNAAMLEDSAQTSSDRRQAREIVRAAGRARNLTQRLSFFATRGSAQFETMEVNQALSELCPIVWRTFPQGVDIDLQVLAQPIYLRANRPDLQDLLTNLLLDAGNTTSGSSVTVQVIPLADLPDQFNPPPNRSFFAITISDGAQPLSDAQRATIFQPGQPMSGNERSIGLLGARAAAEKLEGYLDLDTAPDGGNRFCLYLPQNVSTRQTQDPTNAKISAAVAPEVLVVDDEPAVRRVTVQLLQRAGFVVRSCVSGETAIEEVASHLPDLIVMDLRMPGMGGQAAARAIRADNKKLPIVICTGFTGDAEGWLAKLPNTTLLQKPYDTSELIDTVRTLLQTEFSTD